MKSLKYGFCWIKEKDVSKTKVAQEKRWKRVKNTRNICWLFFQHLNVTNHVLKVDMEWPEEQWKWS